MAEYYITGVWKDASGTITHFAVHTGSIKDGEQYWNQTPVKMAKVDAIKLVEEGNKITTIVWNYTLGKWFEGSAVSVVDNNGAKYLKSAPDEKISDNLGHLICWNNFIQ